jgi:hypothetical protein
MPLILTVCVLSEKGKKENFEDFYFKIIIRFRTTVAFQTSLRSYGSKKVVVFLLLSSSQKKEDILCCFSLKFGKKFLAVFVHIVSAFGLMKENMF